MAASATSSPCTGVCRLDAENRCTGCARTLDEIARWATMPPAERARIMDRVR